MRTFLFLAGAIMSLIAIGCHYNKDKAMAKSFAGAATVTYILAAQNED